MDVLRPLLGATLIIVLSACGSKSADGVFTDESAQANACSGQRMEKQFIVYWEDGHFSVENSTDAETFKREFIQPNLENIRQVVYDKVIQTESGQMTSTSDLSQQAGISWGNQMIESDVAWNAGYTGQGVLVGVVDSYVDTSHVQIASRIQVNAGEIPGNGIDDDHNGYADDDRGMSFISNPGTNPNLNPHGTHVSGIVIADSTKGSAQGVAPGAKVVPAPFLNNSGSGSLGDAIMAMQYVASRGVKVINASWGGAPCDSQLYNAFSEISRRGILMVVAAGNEALDLDRTKTYPAAFSLPTQLTIGAATNTDIMASFSNSGFSTVNLAAPGVGILSTVPGNMTSSFDGTSMAAPFVSGAAAILWSARPLATAVQIRQALMASVDVSPSKEYRVESRGRLNIRKALQELFRLVP